MQLSLVIFAGLAAALTIAPAPAQERRGPAVATTVSVVDTLEGAGAGQWVILDLDDTVMRDRQVLGTDEWFFWEANRLMKERGGTLMDAFVALRPLNVVIKSFSDVVLLEPRLPAALDRLRAKGAVVFGLTSRDPQLSQTTVRQLGSIGVSFEQAGLPVLNELAGLDWSSMPATQSVKFQQGVFYTSGSNKGMILGSILDRVKATSLPSFVRTYDDRATNAFALAKALAERGIDSVNYEYKGGAQRTSPVLRRRLASEQLKAFEAAVRRGPLLGDAEAIERLRLATPAVCRAALSGSSSN